MKCLNSLFKMNLSHPINSDLNLETPARINVSLLLIFSNVDERFSVFHRLVGFLV